MDAQTQEKLKDINRRFEFYQRLDGTGTLFAGQYVEDLDFLLQLVREQEAQLTKYERVVSVAKEALLSVQGIMNESYGVSGWHLNGEIATWGELEIKNEVADALEALE